MPNYLENHQVRLKEGRIGFIPSGSITVAATSSNSVGQQYEIHFSGSAASASLLAPTGVAGHSGSFFYIRQPDDYVLRVNFTQQGTVPATGSKDLSDIYERSISSSILNVRIRSDASGSMISEAVAAAGSRNASLANRFEFSSSISSSYSGSVFITNLITGAPIADDINITYITGSDIHYSVPTSGSGVPNGLQYEGHARFNSSSFVLQIDPLDTDSFFMSSSGGGTFYMSGSGPVGVNTSDPIVDFDVRANEVQFQKKSERRGLLINNEGNIESFDKDQGTSATGSEIILRYSRGVAITRASFLAVTGVDAGSDGAAVTAFNALKDEEQISILKKAESIGFIDKAEAGDVLGSIRWIAESGSVGALTDRITGEACSISAISAESDNTGVAANLSFRIASKTAAATQALLLSIDGTHQITGSLDVSNKLIVNSNIVHKGDTDTLIGFTDDAIRFTAGNENMMQIINHTQDKVLIGDGGDIDFRVVSNGQGVSGTDPSLFVEGSSGEVGIGTNTPGEKLEVIGNISASGNIYSDNIEILAHGSARVSSITNTTDYWGPNFQGPYHTANWNKNVTPEADGNIILERQKGNTGFIVPYSCSLVGFDSIGSMNSGENTHFSMSLFTADALTGMDLNNSSATSPGFTASIVCTGISQGNKGFNRHRMTGSCTVPLSPFSVVFPLVKVDAAGNDDSAMSLDMTYVLKIKRIR